MGRVTGREQHSRQAHRQLCYLTGSRGALDDVRRLSFCEPRQAEGKMWGKRLAQTGFSPTSTVQYSVSQKTEARSPIPPTGPEGASTCNDEVLLIPCVVPHHQNLMWLTVRRCDELRLVVLYILRSIPVPHMNNGVVLLFCEHRLTPQQVVSSP